MQMLLEEERAEAHEYGIDLKVDEAAALDDDTRYIFNLPPRWPGKFELQVDGTSRKADFELRLQLIGEDGEKIFHYDFDNPLLRLSETEQFLPDGPQWQALAAAHRHQTLTSKDEYANLLAVHELIQAAQSGLEIDAAAFKEFQVAQPDKVGLAVEAQPDGSLELSPTFGNDLSQEAVLARLGQLNPESTSQSLRIGKTVMLLDEKSLEAAHDIIRKRHIPAKQRKRFFANPSAFIDAALVDLDSGFSLRVKGAGPFIHAYFGDTGSTEMDWFQGGEDIEDPLEHLSADPELVPPEELSDIIPDASILSDFKQKFQDAETTNASALQLERFHVDISDRARVYRAIEHLETEFASRGPMVDDVGPYAVDIHLNDADIEFGDQILTPPKNFTSEKDVNFDEYTRTPFPHQVEGIRWMLGLATNEHLPEDYPHRIEGALLADDMGLGKTYMAIVGMREILLKTESKKPVLVVAPLSLLENWKREVGDTYRDPLFKNIVILQSDGDLPQYRIEGMGVETRQQPAPKIETIYEPLDPPEGQFDMPPEYLMLQSYATELSLWEDIEPAKEVLPWEDSPTDSSTDTLIEEEDDEPFIPRCALKIGPEWGPDRLDMPETMVLTTYQVLRDYQFSLAMIPWSVVVFDEAQNIKSPNTLQTRAAKALNAEFKLLVTGTPVENHLGEFWCLFDTVQPGLLGSYQTFRQNFIKPIINALPDEIEHVREDVGQELRDLVGGFMLRRIKEDHLPNLPVKRIILGEHDGLGNYDFDPRITNQMKGMQKIRYEDVVNITMEGMSQQNPGVALGGLQKLRDVSLFPGLIEEMPRLPMDSESAQVLFSESGKLGILGKILEEVHERDEKILVFIVNKRLQELVSVCVQRIYGLPVPIINGSTKAVSDNPNNPTRQAIIDEFQAKPGFGVLVISPVAAGVGLTITAANNVVHLERHWNPAKEAQATDRAYRIGQTKDVNVYIPILTHPEFDSFDVNLNRLLSSKTSLKDAIITQEEVQPAELINSGIFVKPDTDSES
ncbi:MAG: DEAD/DEAH box helicase [Pseudomonadota bacterium]